MNKLVSWIVEEVNRNGDIKRHSFNQYDEALDVYNHLKTEKADSFISIQKSEKKLLAE